MRIAFVDELVRFSIPLGITGLAAILREKGHEVALIVIGSEPERALDKIGSFEPDAVAFSVITGSERGYFAFARELKKRFPHLLTLWGGPHLTFYPESIEFPWVDVVCLGEGDEAILEMAEGFKARGERLPPEVSNCWMKHRDGIVRGKMLPRKRLLDDLPFPARDLYLKQFSVLRSYPVKEFMAHRGCPYRCTYCFNEGYNKLYAEKALDRKVFNSRSPDSICDEILWLKRQVPIKMVVFVDDVFTLNRIWALKFCETYARRCRIPFRINARFDNFDGELVEALADAGLHLIHVGVESGDHGIRNLILKREMGEAIMHRTTALLKKRKIQVLTENILGIPGETFEQALKTLRLNFRLRPNYASASCFAPYPKLELTHYAIRHGYFDGDFSRLNHTFYHDSVLRFKTKQDHHQIINLREFFSLFVQHPWLYTLLSPLLKIRPNPLFRFLGDLVDGFYLKRLLPVRFTFRAFIATTLHYLMAYRRGISINRTADAKRPLLTVSAGKGFIGFGPVFFGK